MSFSSWRPGSELNGEIDELNDELRERKAEEWVQTHPDGPPPKRHPVRRLWGVLTGRRQNSGD
jgi:hypothetical protein